ncbi:MAG: hypothetical protein U0414_00885 [Polyangiaceae bacterium]
MVRRVARCFAPGGLALFVAACAPDTTPAGTIALSSASEPALSAIASPSAAPDDSVQPPPIPTVDPRPKPRPPLVLPPAAVPADHRDKLVRASAAFGKIGTHQARTATGREDILLDRGGPSLLRELKDAATAVSLDVVRALGPAVRGARAADLGAVLTQAFAGLGVVGDERGKLAAIELEPLPGRADWLAVCFSIWGDVALDDVALVVSIEGAEPRLLAALRHDGYASITDARFASTFALSPPYPDGSWWIVDAYSHPWITSNWRGITYEVLEPTSAPPALRRVFRVSDSAFLGADAAGTLTTRADGFEVRYQSWETLSERIRREYVRSYRRDGARFTRVAPWASAPEDLVEEWLEADSSATARAMVAPAVQTSAAALWDNLHGAQFHGQAVLTIDGKPAPSELPDTATDATVELVAPLGTKLPRSAGAFPSTLVVQAHRDGVNGWIMGAIAAP